MLTVARRGQWPLFSLNRAYCSTRSTQAVSSRVKRSWDSVSARRAFFDEVAQKLGIQSPSDWKGKAEATRKLGGSGLLKRYRSFVDALREAYPDEDWSILERKGSWGYWASKKNRRAFMDTVAKAYGVESQEGWLRVGSKDVKAMGGGALMERYPSFFEALKDLYPEWEWDARDHRKVMPKNYWADPDHQRNLMDAVKEKYAIAEQSDWQRVGVKELTACGGAALLCKFKSVLKILQSAYPEEEWDERVCRGQVRSQYWDTPTNRRKFMEEIVDELGITCQEGWRRVTPKHFQARNAGGLLARYASIYSLLKDTFPEEAWDAARCRPRVSCSYWEDSDKVRAVLEEVAREFSVEEPHDWYRISVDQIFTVPKGRSLLTAMPLLDALCIAYEDIPWDADRFSKRVKKAEQRWLFVQTRLLFPGLEVIEEPRLPDVVGAPVGNLELDVYVPALKLGFEYQGKHHYEERPFFGPLEAYQRRDRLKDEACAAHGITLVHIPYWWDQKLPSLAATLHATSPAILEAAISSSSVEQ